GGGPKRPPLATALPPVIAVEAEYRREIASGLRTSGEGAAPAEFFRWSEQLGGLGGRVQGLTQWESIEGQVRAVTGQLLRALDEGLTGPLAAVLQDWRGRLPAPPPPPPRAPPPPP